MNVEKKKILIVEDDFNLEIFSKTILFSTSILLF